MRQQRAALRREHTTEWNKLARPKYIAGIGDGTKVCTDQAILPGRLAYRSLMKFSCAVIPGRVEGDSPNPGLLGNDSMAAMNVYFGTRHGGLHMVPEGSDDQIKWPKGTRHIQMTRAPSRHWMVEVGCWDDEDEPESYQCPSELQSYLTNGSEDEQAWLPQIVGLWKRHAPGNLSNLSYFLQKYHGRLSVLHAGILQKYQNPQGAKLDVCKEFGACRHCGSSDHWGNECEVKPNSIHAPNETDIVANPIGIPYESTEAFKAGASGNTGVGAVVQDSA